MLNAESSMKIFKLPLKIVLLFVFGLIVIPIVRNVLFPNVSDESLGMAYLIWTLFVIPLVLKFKRIKQFVSK